MLSSHLLVDVARVCDHLILLAGGQVRLAAVRGASMTWLAWRQLRSQALLATLTAAAVTAALLATHGRVAAAADPGNLPTPITSLRLLGTALVGLPAFIGAFWGSPLVARELEAGTQRLVWTQGITRDRWLGTKLMVVGTATVAFTGVCTSALTWWSVPFDEMANRIGPATFGQRGIVPVAYALFALALGTLLGLLVRRTLPAMAATLVAYFVVRFSFQTFVRPHLFATTTAERPSTMFGPDESRSAASEGWVLSSRAVDASGHALSPNGAESLVQEECNVVSSTTAEDLSRCVDRLGIHEVVQLHPAGRFWDLQVAEAGVLVLLALVLAFVSFWVVRRRTA